MSYRRPIPRFNILDFGAHADSGTTDNTPAVRRAALAAIASGRGLVEFSLDPENPTGFYDMKSMGGLLSMPSGVTTMGFVSRGAIPRLRISNMGLNYWFQISATYTNFLMKNLCFFSDDDSFPNCYALMEIVGAQHYMQGCVFDHVATQIGVLFIDNSASRIVNCLQAGSGAAVGFGQWTFDDLRFASIENCQFLDSGVFAESNIRVRNPSEWPNLGAPGVSKFIARGMVFGEQCIYTVNVTPTTMGKRLPYVEIDGLDFQPNGQGYEPSIPVATCSGAIMVQHTERVRIKDCGFNWQTRPLQPAVIAIDAGDVELDGCICTDALNGQYPLGVRRIYADSTTRSLKLTDCTYQFLDTQCSDVTIVQGGVTTYVSQDTSGGGQRVYVEDTPLGNIDGVAGGGGTGTLGLLTTPGANNQLSAQVTSAQGETDPANFSAVAEAIVSNIAAVCHVTAATQSTVGADAAYGATAVVYAAGSGSTADQAVLTATNHSAGPVDFSVRTSRKRTWPAWHPGLLLDVFGPKSRQPTPPLVPLIVGWYDHSTLVNTGGFVATWKDRSGFHNDLTAAGAARPVYNAAGNNGLPEADFAGAQSMTAAITNAFNQGGCIFTVGTFTADSQTHATMSATAGVWTVGDLTLWRAPGATDEILMNGGSLAGDALVGTAWHTRLGSVWDVDADFYLDGTLATGVVGADATLTSLAHLTVGARSDLSNFLTGGLQLVMIFSVPPPISLATQLEAWAKSIYATP